MNKNYKSEVPPLDTAMYAWPGGDGRDASGSGSGGPNWSREPLIRRGRAARPETTTRAGWSVSRRQVTSSEKGVFLLRPRSLWPDEPPLKLHVPMWISSGRPRGLG